MKKIGNEYYEILTSFLKESAEILAKKRTREFVIVSHTFLSSYMDNFIVEYLVENDKEEKFLEVVTEFRFPLKVKILKDNNLIPNKLAKILENYNTIRNKAAHYVEWEQKILKANLIIKSDSGTLGAIPSGLLGALDACRGISYKNEIERKKHLDELNEDFEKDGVFSHWLK